MAMAFIPALVFACSLASGHRIQPVGLANQRKSTSNSALAPGDSFASAQSEQRSHYNQSLLNKNTQIFGDEPRYEQSLHAMSMPTAASTIDSPTSTADQTSAEPLANSLLQEQMYLGKKFRSFLDNEKVKNFRDSYLSSVPEPVLGYLAGVGLVALSVAGCWLARLFASFFPQCSRRKQHLHNGRVVYEWDQTPKVATIYIRPPKWLTKNDLDIRISARHLRVARKGKPSFLREEIFELVNEEMSSWSLRSSGELQIYLKKAKKAEWPTVLLHKLKPSGSESLPGSFGAKIKLPN